jgi:hypothetical protein
VIPDISSAERKEDGLKSAAQRLESSQFRPVIGYTRRENPATFVDPTRTASDQAEVICAG